MDAVSEKSRLAKHWVDNLIRPVLLILLYIRAEIEGEFALHPYVCNQMLPYFFAAGHWNYARDGVAYVRMIEKLPHCRPAVIIKNDPTTEPFDEDRRRRSRSRSRSTGRRPVTRALSSQKRKRITAEERPAQEAPSRTPRQVQEVFVPIPTRGPGDLLLASYFQGQRNTLCIRLTLAVLSRLVILVVLKGVVLTFLRNLVYSFLFLLVGVWFVRDLCRVTKPLSFLPPIYKMMLSY